MMGLRGGLVADATSLQHASLKTPPKDFSQILVVDDESVIQHLIKAMFETKGYTNVKTVSSGEAAINTLLRQEFHLVMLDKNLPGIDGLGVLKECKRLCPGCQVIMMTGYASMESAIEAMHLGAFSYLTKPFNEMDKVFERAQSALERVIGCYREMALIGRLEGILSELGGIENESDRSAVTRRALQAADQVRRVVTELKQL